MKSTFTLLAGIVFLTAISISGCSNSSNSRELKKVYIFIASVEINGVIHLKLRDSNGNSAIDTLCTTVHPGEKVIWKKEKDSGLKRITDIKSIGSHNIFIEKPRKKFFKDEHYMDILKDANGKEEYAIGFKLKDNSSHIIDPYLRIPPPSLP